MANPATTTPPTTRSLPSRLSLPDAKRIRSYFLRLPLATRLLLFVITALYIAQLISPGLDEWGALIPNQINFKTLYRLNTYPLLHLSLFHYILNTATLTPLLERFESESGTLVTLALFTGPFGLLPGLAYTLLERYIFHLNTLILGSSIWVFLLLSHESIKTFRANPYFNLTFLPQNYRIPTWTSPLLGIVIVSFLVPHTSFLGHLCGAATGYAWGLGWIRFLAPPDKVLRWVEGKLNLLGRVPHFVSVDQKTYGRYGVLPSTNGNGGGGGGGGGGVRAGPSSSSRGAGGGPVEANGVPLGPVGSTQRLGP